MFFGHHSATFAQGELPGKWRRGIEFYKKLCYTKTNNTKGGGDMSNNLFSKVDGKAIVIDDFQIEKQDEKLHIKMTFNSEDQNAYFVVFENISKLNLSEISYPFQICGFEILDYSSRGYQKDCRFFVGDYEDGKLSFFCENFEIFNANR